MHDPDAVRLAMNRVPRDMSVGTVGDMESTSVSPGIASARASTSTATEPVVVAVQRPVFAPVTPVISWSAPVVDGLRGGTWEGPWDQAFWFEVPCAMRSKSNARRGGGASSRAAWRDLSAYEVAVRRAAEVHLPAGWVIGDAKLAVRFRPQVVSFIYARSLIDAANFSKSTLDSVEGVVYVTDAAVRHSAALGERARANPEVIVAFARLRPDATAAELLAAAAALGAAWLATS